MDPENSEMGIQLRVIGGRFSEIISCILGKSVMKRFKALNDRFLVSQIIGWGGGGKECCDPSALPLTLPMLGTIEGFTEIKLTAFPQGQLLRAYLFTDKIRLWFFSEML